MTEGGTVTTQLERWVVVVSPRGDVIRLDDRYSEYRDAASLFQLVLDGRLDDGRPVTVRGTHVALAWREPVDVMDRIWRRATNG